MRSAGICCALGPQGRDSIAQGASPRCSTHLFESSAIGWAEGVPAEGQVVHPLKSFLDRFNAGHRADRAVHEAAQLADHSHHLSQCRRGLRRRFLLSDLRHRFPFRDLEHRLATQVGKLATHPHHKHRPPRNHQRHGHVTPHIAQRLEAASLQPTALFEHSEDNLDLPSQGIRRDDPQAACDPVDRGLAISSGRRELRRWHFAIRELADGPEFRSSPSDRDHEPAPHTTSARESPRPSPGLFSSTHWSCRRRWAMSRA